MTYPPVIQFETRAAEVEAETRLTEERRVVRAPNATTDRWRRFMKRLPLPRLGARAADRAPLTEFKLTDCEQ